ncbi:hypothetical protein DBP19_36035 [Streptomyces sp. CS090A]|uniref:hypothetical protein n=1 Tax=Streptomyces sp. CS090A TaxID=2162710 RepID=UPI000D5162D7|nr:hypothetical protein [Streptomyces sp. CS090A]PVC80549.1 hypothetical protein DBP19_36035 [Streptomyces sp. CS090A]
MMVAPHQTTPKGLTVLELRLLDPDGYTVPDSVTPVTPTTETKARTALRDLARDHAHRYAHARYDHRNYRITTRIPEHPAQLAGMLLDPTTAALDFLALLTAQTNPSRARQVLADAYTAAANQIRNAT